MSICVAVGNKVMDTRLPQPAGCGDKYDVSGLDLKHLLNTCCLSLKYPSPDAKASPSPARGEVAGLLRCVRNGAERTNIVLKGLDVVRQYAALLERRVQTGTRARKALVVTRQANPLGRSMIEMLGVLAIIGVLSVGGIAGYSKAMEKWKLDKAIGDYSMMIQGILEHREDFYRQSHNIETFSLSITDTLQALNIVPANWQKNEQYLIDNMGNYISIVIAPALYDMPDRISINILLGGVRETEENNFTEGFSVKLCTTLYTDLIIPLQNSIWKTSVYRKNSGNPPAWAGSAYCTKNENCLNNMTLKDIHELCSSCDNKNDMCGVNFNL